MSRNPFFHAPAPDAPNTFTGTIQDALGGVVIVALIVLALVVL